MTDPDHIFRALGDPTRLAILGLIRRHGPLCVCEVERILDISQSKASRHLRYLRGAGILYDRRAGQVVHYRLPAAPTPLLADVLELLDRHLTSPPEAATGRALTELRAARDGDTSADGDARTRAER